MKNKFFIFPPLFIAAMAALCAANPGSIVATLSEMQSLTDAMELVYLDIGGYVSIENLNDLLSEQTTHDFDNISQGGGTRVIDTTTAFFHPQLQNLSMPPRRWLGPYVTYHESRISLTGSGYDKGTLLDFWGTPYYLFSPAGLVRSDQGAITLELYGDYFDSYAIVSLGPDGVKSSDDLIRTFGMPPIKPVITSLSATSAYAGDELRLRGWNLGTQSGERAAAALLLGATPITTIKSWSERLIEFTVPEGAASGNIRIVRGASETNSLPLTILEHPTAVRHWNLYE